MGRRTLSLRQRVIGIGAAAALALGGVVVGAVPSQAEQEGPLRDLGPALGTVDVGPTATGVDAEGNSLMYAVVNGHPPTFNVIDTKTGEVIFAEVLEGEEFLGSRILPVGDDLVYFNVRSNRSTQFYSYDVENKTVEKVVRTCADCEIEPAVMRVFDVDDDGTIYMGSYPRAAVYSYNPETDTVRDYGSVTNEQYLWGLSLGKNNQLFVGTGIGPGQGGVVQVDTETGEYADVPFPEGVNKPQSTPELQVMDDILIVPVSGSPNRINFYNYVNEEWVCRDVEAPGSPTPVDAFDEKQIAGTTFFRTGDTVYKLDVPNCKYTKVMDTEEAGLEGGFRGVRQVITGSADNPQLDSLMMYRTDGSYVLIDPDTRDVEEKQAEELLPSYLTPHSIGLGGDGNVYFGFYLSPDAMAKMDPATEERVELSGPEQADKIQMVGDRLIVTSYPNGVVHSADLSQEWEWDTNPEQLFRLIGDEQDRIFEIVDADGLGVVGSVPEYGHLGGGLAVFDPETGDHDVYTEEIPEDQSIGALAYDAGTVYSGTTTQGGLGVPKTAEHAVLFEFDMETRTVTHEVTPDPEAETIGALEFGNGELWGMTDTGLLFQYDPETHDIVDSVEVPGAGGSVNWGRLPELHFNETDGRFYGISATRHLFAFDPASSEVEEITSASSAQGDLELKSMQIMPDGGIYLIDQTNVWHYAPSNDDESPSPSPSPTESGSESPSPSPSPTQTGSESPSPSPSPTLSPSQSPTASSTPSDDEKPRPYLPETGALMTLR